MKDMKKYMGSHKSGGGNAVYCLGIIGALVYYFQQATSFWMIIAGIFKAIFWPAFVVHALLKFLGM